MSRNDFEILNVSNSKLESRLSNLEKYDCAERGSEHAKRVPIRLRPMPMPMPKPRPKSKPKLKPKPKPRLRPNWDPFGVFARSAQLYYYKLPKNMHYVLNLYKLEHYNGNMPTQYLKINKVNN